MSPPEVPYFNIKRMHWVFAISSLALLAVTLWMLGADHWREWKLYQATYRDRIEPWLTEARLAAEQGQDYLQQEQALAEALAQAQSASGEPAALDVLRKQVDAARFRQRGSERKLRFRKADFDEARSAFEAAVGVDAQRERLDKLQARADEIKADVERLELESQTAAENVAALAAILAKADLPVLTAQKAIADHRAGIEQLHRTLAQQNPSTAKGLLRMPVVDAFGRPLAVEQIWLPELTIDYNFQDVARFDRCVTCHQGIAKTKAGKPHEGAIAAESIARVKIVLAGDDNAEEEDKAIGIIPSNSEPSLSKVYGMSLAQRGMVCAEAPTVGVILPLTPAAKSDLAVGDVILTINGKSAQSRDDVEKRLLAIAAGKTDEDQPQDVVVELEVRRGLKHPFQSHPRLDLFVGSTSPHPVAEFGCTICHDGQGSATSFKFASHAPNDPAQRKEWKKEQDWFRNKHWDFPMMPKRFVESRCLKCHHDVADLEPSERFKQPPAPKLMAGYHLVRQNGCFGCHEIKGLSPSGRSIGPDMRLEPGSVADDSQLAPDPTVGTMRKVGPSLRGLAGRLDAAFIRDWTANPTRFKSATRMPHFFGLDEHLDGRRLDDARRFEAVELAAMTRWLLDVSQAVAPVPLPPQVTEPASVERGKASFEIQGCLACHKHADFPQSQGTQGPDLSDLGTKYSGEKASAWLASWIRDPARHAPRTVMPNTMLEPLQLPADNDTKDAKPRFSDPPTDIAAYLLAGKGLQPADPPALVEKDMDELALLHLSKTFPRAQAQRYLAEGIPENQADCIQGDAVELLGKITPAKKLRYVGRRTIAKRGCYACHDIPGFESAQPIGPQLSDWGRKQESLLLFGQVHRFVGPQKPENTNEEFFKEALLSQRREGFLWQKLRAPRSFDYKMADNKGYNEQLTMGRFNFTPEESEAISTFILGLVSEPPAEKYVHKPQGRRRAVVAGQKVIDKYACSTCHTLEMERWKIRFDPELFEPPEAAEGDYDFLAPQISPQQVAASTATDRRSLAQAELVGMPLVGDDGLPLKLEGDEEDDQGEPLPMRAFSLWEPAVINGNVCSVGGADVLVYDRQIVERQAPLGGQFARLLYPVALGRARAAGANVAGMEAWGWGPPPLAGEGEVVQPAWLHDYLLNPTQIRPAAVLRMPKYNMSADEAAKLVDYFAAKSHTAYPYTPVAQGRRANDLLEKDKKHPHRLDDAMRIVADRTTYCAKCHLVGDFNPGGETKTILAPNLDEVGRRIRADYIRRWLANPKAAVPYTGMPVNFPPQGDPLGQDLFKGDSLEQLEAVTDLLLNFDRQMSRKTSVRKMVEDTEKEEARKKAVAAKKDEAKQKAAAAEKK